MYRELNIEMFTRKRSFQRLKKKSYRSIIRYITTKDHVPLIRIKRYRNIYKEFVPAQETWYRKDGVLTTMQGLRMKNKRVRDVYCGLTATKCSSLITEIRKTDDR